jgi:hypothetical protein
MSRPPAPRDSVPREPAAAGAASRDPASRDLAQTGVTLRDPAARNSAPAVATSRDSVPREPIPRHPGPRGQAALLPLMLIYGAASLLHFIHNAVYLRDYPNLPAWLTAGGVCAAWLVVAGTGVLGYLLYSRVSRVAGLVTIATYAAFGLGGLDHYTVAPISAHTLAMNLTILLEAATAVVLLVCVARSALLVAAQRVKLRG